MKTFLAILFSAFFLAVAAQDNPVIENGQAYDKSLVKPFMNSLHNENDYVLTFRTTVPSNPDPDYFVLTKKGSKLSAYIYDQKDDVLQNLTVKTDSLKNLLWKAYMDFDMFKIKDESQLSIFCPEKYFIFGSYTYEITLISKDGVKNLSYYDPEYYDKWCYGLAERQKVINTASLISYVLSFSRVN